MYIYLNPDTKFNQELNHLFTIIELTNC